MSNPIHRLQPAVQVARSREEDAAQGLGNCQRRLAEQQARLQQLLAFRSEYTEHLQSVGQRGISAHNLQNYAAFLANLEHSIAQLQQQLESLQGECQCQRAIWVTSRAKTLGLEGVIQHHRLEQSRAEERREQAETDERALRSRWKATDF